MQRGPRNTVNLNTTISGNPDFYGLSRESRLLIFSLLTCDYVIDFPGLFLMGPGTIGEMMHEDPKDVRQWMVELEKSGCAKIDHKKHVIWIVEANEYILPGKVHLGSLQKMLLAADRLPACEVRNDAVLALYDELGCSHAWPFGDREFRLIFPEIDFDKLPAAPTSVRSQSALAT